MILARVYRRMRDPVKSVALLLMLCFLAARTEAQDLEEELGRARHLEQQLGRWTAWLAEGRDQEVELAIESLGPRADREPRVWNLKGLLARARGDLPEAIDSFERGIRLDPLLAELHFNLATTLVRGRQLGRAIAEFERTIELRPRDVEALLGYGHCLMQLRRWAPAREALLSAHALDESDAQVLAALSQLADSDGDAAEQRRWWERLEEVAPSADTARRLGELARATDPREAVEQFDRCRQRDPGALDCLEAAAILLLASSDPEAALSRLTQVEVEELSDAGFFHLLLAQQRLGHFDDIEAIVARRTPDSANEWSVVALGRYQSGPASMKGALEAIERAGVLDGQSPDVWNLRGVILDALGRRDEALEALRRALELDPTHGPALENLDSLGLGS